MEKQNTSVIQKLSISYECALAIGNSLNLSEMLHDVIHTIVHKTNAHRGSIWLREKEGENIKLGARAGSLLTKAEIKKRVSAFQDIFEKIWKNQLPVIKNRNDKDFFQYCFKITGKEQSVLIVPIKNVAILKLVYTNKEIVNETLANILLSLSEKLSIAINACLAHDNIKREIQIRKDTEQNLLDSEKKYRALIATTEEGIGTVDENENFTFINQAAANMFGYSRKELLGKNLKLLTTPEEFQRILEQTSIRKTGKSSKYELSIFRNDGKQRILSVTATPKFDNNGRYQGTFGIFSDITESKHAIAELEQSEEKYHTLIDNIQDGVFIIQDVKMQFVNESFARMVGYIVEETIGMDFRQLIAPEDIEIVADRYRRRQAGEDVPGEYEFRMLHKDGVTRVIVRMNVGLVNYQGKLASMGTVKDITEQKQTEAELKNKSEQITSDKEKIEGLYKDSEDSRKSLLSILEDVSEKENALRESEERFQNIVANTGDWIWETDEKGCYTYSSPVAKQVLGYECQEILGKHFYDFFVPEEREKLKKAAFEVFKKKEKFQNLINKNVHKDGHIVILETNAVPLLDDKGNLLGYRGVDRDISERKRAEQTQSVLYNIADAVNTTKDLDELFKSIQSYLSTILDTTNFFIALYDKETDTISLPYHVDKKDKFTSFPAGKTFTGYVIKKGKPLLATEQVMKKLIQTGEVEQIGTFSKIWLGVPLKIENEVTGVVAVQSYTDASRYTEKDLAILEFVSDSIAIAIAHIRADNALENSEEKYRLLFEETPVGILTCDINGIIQSINNTALQLLGSPSEEATKQINLLTFPPLKEIGFSDNLKHCMNEGKEISAEKLYTSKWRKSVFFHYKVIPTLNQEGKITGALCALEDITEQKRAEQTQSVLYNIADAVNTSKNLYELFKIIHKQLSLIINTTNLYVALYNKETDTISLPYDVDQKDRFTTFPAGKTLTDYVIKTGKSLLANEEVSKKLVQAGEVEIIGTPSKIWLGVPLKVENKVIGVVAVQSYIDSKLYTQKDMGILEFVSDQIAIAIAHMRADNALENSEKKFRDLFENANDVIWTSDIRGRYLSVNHLFEKLLGYTKKELINKQSLFLVDPENRKNTIKMYQKVISGESVEFEAAVLNKKGEKRIYWLKLRPIKEGSKVIGVHGIGRDITERIQAQEALRRSEEQLRQAQKMEAVGRLAGGMAHDFNNLLTAITGYSELLLNKLGEIDPLSKYPKEISKAAEQASSLTSQLLTFSRKQVLELKVLDINAVVTEMQKMLHRLIGEDIELVTVLEPKLGSVKADIGQIYQVIMNMVVNARDAMPNGGKINLETANLELDKEYARQHVEVEAGPYVMLAVTDTGCGMDEETQSHIFEPFFTTKEINKGTGLGLSIVYGIIKQSGGSIWVYSEIGQGTTFKIYLPRVDEGVEIPKPTIVEPELLKGSETILLVEDKEMVRDLILEILETNGYTVLAASLGREAISICKQHKDTIHLMLTDVVMPQMSGCELAKQLKTLRPDMKVLFMSGYTGKEVIERGILEPGTAFIQKPMSPDDLAHKVREVLEAPIQKKG
ncbi:MAG: PAS domain S-box protein [Candidatus Cloacimonetes bacterium]|nr:PAS domain S-box protein [Candidatus Cloacimonadota bacterium]